MDAKSNLASFDVPFLAVIAIYLLSALYLAYGLQSLPTCPSCDYYFEQGNIIHLSQAFNLASDSSTHLGHISQGPQLYYYVPALMVFAFNITAMQSSLAFSFLLIPVSLYISYSLFKIVFKRNDIALLCTAMLISPASFPLFKYSEFAQVFSIPLFFYLLFLFDSSPKHKNALFLGLGIGIMVLSHANTFFLSYVAMAAYAGLSFLDGGMRKLSLVTPGIAIACTAGFLISLIWWYNPLFEFGGNPYLGFGFNTPNLSHPSVFAYETFSLFIGIFYNIGSLRLMLFSLICVLACGELIQSWKRNQLNLRVLVVCLAFFVAVFHFIITSPLFGKDFSPSHSFIFLFPVLAAFLTGMVFSNAKEGGLLVAAAILLVVFAGILDVSERRSSGLYQLGFSKLPECDVAAYAYVAQNTGINDVFLSTPYVCNNLNGNTGRKCLQMDRGHSSKFDEMDSGFADSAIILYGNNTSEKLSLLRKRSVKYLYWNFNKNSIYGDEFFNVGNRTLYGHPMIYSREIEQALMHNGVGYYLDYTWIDSSMRGDLFRRYDVIALSPSNIQSISHPWKPDLDAYLEESWRCGNASVIYRVIVD